jgi:hypothetical protein
LVVFCRAWFLRVRRFIPPHKGDIFIFAVGVDADKAKESERLLLPYCFGWSNSAYSYLRLPFVSWAALQYMAFADIERTRWM